MNLHQPAVITEGEWQEHRGELAAASGVARRLERVVVPKLERALEAVDANVDILKGMVSTLRDEVRDGDRAVRETSSADLRAELEAYKAQERERELGELTRKARESRAWWLDLAKIVVAAVVGAGLVKFFHL